MPKERLVHLVAAGQGILYVLTGLWAVVHIQSFEMVTGPKTDDWLVKTVGLLVTVVGGVLLVAARRAAVTAEIALLAVGCALALAAIDVVYVLGGVILPIYLLDAAAEVGLVVLWAIAWIRR